MAITVQHLESYASFQRIQTRNVFQNVLPHVATCFSRPPAQCPSFGTMVSPSMGIEFSSIKSFMLWASRRTRRLKRDEICGLDFQLRQIVYIYICIYIYMCICIYIYIFVNIYIYGHSPHQGLPWAFFRGILQQKKHFILNCPPFCVTDLHTTTQVRYSLTLVFLQFLNGHLVTPHPKTARLPSLQSKIVFVDELL